MSDKWKGRSTEFLSLETMQASTRKARVSDFLGAVKTLEVTLEIF